LPDEEAVDLIPCLDVRPWPNINLEIYLWAAKMQRRIDGFIASDTAEATISQRSNLRYHLSMLIVEKLNGRAVKGHKGSAF
jgi:hypothetical protein